MKNMLILLAVAMISADSVGCCCRRLCPWLDRGAACCPLRPAAAPLVAAPAPVGCPPGTVPQYATPLAAPMASPVAAAPCAAPACTYWDPCQNAVLTQPVAGQPSYAQPSVAQPPIVQQQQPMMAPQGMIAPGMIAPNMMSFAEPNCAYVAEPACGEPFMGEVSYGPSFTSDCENCGIVSEGSFSAPPPESFESTPNQDPAPVEAE